jgi:hypothetical protein
VVRELARVTAPGGVVLIGQVPNARRRMAWHRAYAARFDSRQQSHLRWWLGSAKHRVVQCVRAALAVGGWRPPAGLHFLYYTAEFFQGVAARSGLSCEVLPAFNLLYDGSGPQLADYRLDVRLTVPTADRNHFT